MNISEATIIDQIGKKFSVSENGKVFWIKGSRKNDRRADRETQSGYLMIHLMIKGKRFFANAHRIIWIHFNGDIPEGLEINHIDGNKANNHPANLECVSHQENHKHRVAVLKKGLGESNSQAKLRETDVLNIRAARLSGEPSGKIAKQYNITAGHVWSVCSGKAWKHFIEPTQELAFQP